MVWRISGYDGWWLWRPPICHGLMKCTWTRAYCGSWLRFRADRNPLRRPARVARVARRAATALKAGAVTITESRPARRLRESLIGFEVGVGTLLLIMAGLLTTSMVRLLGVDKGFTTEHVLAVDVSLPPQSYTKPEQKDRVLR